MSDKEQTYKEAYQELESIVTKIEGDEVEIDELSMLVKRANELRKFCEERLKKVEEEIQVDTQSE